MVTLLLGCRDGYIAHLVTILQILSLHEPFLFGNDLPEVTASIVPG